MVREHFERPLRDGNGLLLVGCQVRVLEPGTTTAITETLYSHSTGPEEVSNPWVADSGVVDFYLDQPKTVRIGVFKPGGTDETFFEDIEVGDSEIYKETFTFTLAGVVSVGVGSLRLYFDDASEILQVRASAGVPPSGADLIVDINRNGTSLFTDPADRPRVADGANTGLHDFSSAPIPVAVEDYLTLDIDQVGSSTPGTHLVVQVRVRRL